jgi:hypothetical protein
LLWQFQIKCLLPYPLVVWWRITLSKHVVIHGGVRIRILDFEFFALFDTSTLRGHFEHYNFMSVKSSNLVYIYFRNDYVISTTTVILHDSEKWFTSKDMTWYLNMSFLYTIVILLAFLPLFLIVFEELLLDPDQCHNPLYIMNMLKQLSKNCGWWLVWF